MLRLTTIEVVVLALLASTADADDDQPEGETVEIVDRAPPGAKTTLDKERLEREETDDLHKILGNVAGVYLRDEDGYGLRPNIGMRGAAADRSSKITLMEDGVLIAPAPYTAPAAYYTPLMTRMSRVEVTKGPSAIRFGPNTVGGAVDLISEPMPGERAGYVDIAGGSDNYGKLHLRAAERRERWGVMGEYVGLRTDGFKDLDNGGPTGFAKHDALLTMQATSAPSAAHYHTLELKLGYGHETSHETYTGLTDEDFAVTPQRRYMGSQLDEMTWNHFRYRARHKLELGLHARIETVAYRHDFHRVWGKVDGFVGQRDFYSLIANPDAGANQVYYAILSGQADTGSPEEELILGTNNRRFASQGIQSTFSAEQPTGDFNHHVAVGARIHFDRADRRRFEEAYQMVGGVLIRSERPEEKVLDSRAETIALATFVEDRVYWRRFQVAVGTRVELIDFRYADRLTQAQNAGDYAVIIPGAGVEYTILDGLSALAGVHRGFVPVAPTAASGVLPESSINYEAGLRLRGQRISGDLIGFFSDYKNLKGSCSLASGCTEMQEGEEFNGGRVHVYGAELQAGSEWPLTTKLVVPLSAAYTYTHSAFQSSFSSDFAGWGDVEKGEGLPYLPRHILAVSGGVKAKTWELGGRVSYLGESRDVAGAGSIEPAVRAESLLTVNLNGHVRVREHSELYATCTNLLDEQVVISRRPYGARPNAPRLVSVGYKGRF